MNNPVIWIHDDAVRPTHPGLARWPSQPAIFPIDDNQLPVDSWSYKRMVFLYECALEVPCEIARGNPVDLIDEFGKQHEADGIVTLASICPRHRIILGELRKIWKVEVYPAPSFLRAEADFDLKRFSRYWATAKDLLPLPASKIRNQD